MGDDTNQKADERESIGRAATTPGTGDPLEPGGGTGESGAAEGGEDVVQICKSCMISRPGDERFCLECGDELVPIRAVRDSYLGEMIGGKYKIVEKIGSGGMGEVYLGVNEPLGQRVAVKFLSQKYTANEQVIMRFLNEARSYCKVSHPNAVTLLDYGQHDDGALYLITEYIEGRSLTDTVHEDGRLDARQALSVAAQCCEVLSAAHQQGVIHRDLKPDNIMLMTGHGGRFAVKILDFGIAKIVDDERGQLTKTGSVFGTPEFMSPEQAQGREADPRSDLYALGIILFYALTARLPFEGDSQFKILEAHIHEAPPRPSEVREDIQVPLRLEAVIMKCLNKEPEGRYDRAEELLEVLEENQAALAGSGTSDTFDSAPADASEGGAEVSPQSTGPTEAYPEGYAEGSGAPGEVADAESRERPEESGPERRFAASEPGVPATALGGEIEDLGGGDSTDSEKRREDSGGFGEVDIGGEREPTPIDFGSMAGRDQRPLIGIAVAFVLVGALVVWNSWGGGGGADAGQSANAATGGEGTSVGQRLEDIEESIAEGRVDRAREALTALREGGEVSEEALSEKKTELRRLGNQIDLLKAGQKTAGKALQAAECDRAEKAIETIAGISEPAAAPLRGRLEECRRREAAAEEREAAKKKERAARARERAREKRERERRAEEQGEKQGETDKSKGGSGGSEANSGGGRKTDETTETSESREAEQGNSEEAAAEPPRQISDSDDEEGSDTSGDQPAEAVDEKNEKAAGAADGEQESGEGEDGGSEDAPEDGESGGGVMPPKKL